MTVSAVVATEIKPAKKFSDIHCDFPWNDLTREEKTGFLFGNDKMQYRRFVSIRLSLEVFDGNRAKT